VSEIPPSWIRLRFGELNCFTSRTLDPRELANERFELYSVPSFPSGRPELQMGGGIGSTKQLVEPDDVLVCKINPRINRVWQVLPRREYPQIASSEWIVMRAPEVDPRFLLYFFRSPDFRELICEGVTGVGGSLTRAQPKRVATFAVPLAPLDEQKRIAHKLEAVLARVDSCRQHLDRLSTLLKKFRQAALVAATSGKLTEEWRASEGRNVQPWNARVSGESIPLPNGYRRLSKQALKLTKIDHSASGLPLGWNVTTIGDLYIKNVLIDFADGNHGSLYPRKGDFGHEGALFLTATQIGENWELDLQACPRLRSYRANQLTKGWARAGDVLLTHNATVGRVALLENVDERLLLGTSVTFYRFNTSFFEPRYARVLFSSKFFQDQLSSVMKQTTRDQVPITKQASLNVLCPPIEEQTEIARRVEALFGYASMLEIRSNAARTKVEQLTPAFLDKAFRGELVPQDQNDEPASVLLERIRSARSLESKRTRTRKEEVVQGARPKEAYMLNRKAIRPAHLANILKEQGPLTAETLWSASQLEIDEFYDQLKDEESHGLLKEKRPKSPDGPRLLEAVA
jgi:type I restriction enzyme, S subunit